MDTKTLFKAGGVAALLVSAALVQTAASFSQAHAQPLVQQRVVPEPPARSYLCFEGSSAAEVMKKANEAGSRGWKMVAASAGNRGAIWCFEQLTAVRPQVRE